MNYIILDLEATCWQGNAMDRRQEVIELAAYHVNGYGEWGEHFSAFVKPVDHPRLSAYCTELTHITQDLVDKARKFDVVFSRFQEWLEGIDHPQLLCTWGAKDIPILLAECKRHDFDADFLPPAINLKSQYAQLHKLYKEVGLMKAIEHSGLEFEGDAHRAIHDAYNTTRLFLQYIDHWQY
jgi:inhibitor of KinA sporulation pathway (predicted exonuclease)